MSACEVLQPYRTKPAPASTLRCPCQGSSARKHARRGPERTKPAACCGGLAMDPAPQPLLLQRRLDLRRAISAVRPPAASEPYCRSAQRSTLTAVMANMFGSHKARPPRTTLPCREHEPRWRASISRSLRQFAVQPHFPWPNVWLSYRSKLPVRFYGVDLPEIGLKFVHARQF